MASLKLLNSRLSTDHCISYIYYYCCKHDFLCSFYFSWDRWVVEDQVLKDSENNRSLMARLHEQALK